ncbi:MAG: pro-sigmaK processing inhibitor BofA [Clostridia bacterium]|nr:pro-sigmaK processing inhibitor BofA [Clostridia bacterium]
MAGEILQLAFAVLFLLFVLYLLGSILLKPLKLIFKLVVNSLLGVVLLWVFNFLGAFFNFFIPLNVVTVLIAGFLGLPGLILLVVLNLVL